MTKILHAVSNLKSISYEVDDAQGRLCMNATEWMGGVGGIDLDIMSESGARRHSFHHRELQGLFAMAVVLGLVDLEEMKEDVHEIENRLIQSSKF